MPDKDTSAPLLPDCIIRSLLYYAQAVNSKLLVALNAISAQQAKAAIHTDQLVETLLNYVAIYPNDGIAHADAGYLNETLSHSRAGAHIFLLEDNPSPRFNSVALTIATIIKFVMALAAEAKLAALFISACKMVPH
jgi:hypothetical protein